MNTTEGGIHPITPLSRMRSRSNGASAPKIWKASVPLGIVVSTPSVSEQNPMPRSSSAAAGLDQMSPRSQIQGSRLPIFLSHSAPEKEIRQPPLWDPLMIEISREAL